MSRDAERQMTRSILMIQPEPIQTLLASLTTVDGSNHTLLVRRWPASVVSRCSLCRTCTAKVGLDNQAVCVVTVEGPLDEGSAPLFSTEFPG